MSCEKKSGKENDAVACGLGCRHGTTVGAVGTDWVGKKKKLSQTKATRMHEPN